MSEAQTIYLDRDNSVDYRLQINGVAVDPDVIVRAIFALPPQASVDGQEQVFDTSIGSEAQLLESGTVLRVRGGGRALKPRRLPYNAEITLFDSASVDGQAWASVPIKVSAWRPESE